MQLLPRGVHELPMVNDAGNRLACAVRDGGVMVALLSFNPQNHDIVTKALWDILEAAERVPMKLLA